MPTSKVELYAAIRRDVRAGLSGRAIERKYRGGRRTIVAAMSSAWPAQRKKLPPRTSKLDPFKPVVDAILRADLDAPRKQRHTVTRIYARLLDEHAMTGVSYQVLRTYVAVRRPEIRVEAGHGPAQVFIPQSHRPGVETLCGIPHNASYEEPGNMRHRPRAVAACAGGRRSGAGMGPHIHRLSRNSRSGSVGR